MSIWHWNFKILYLKFNFRKIGPKIKISLDLHGNFHSNHKQGVEYRSGMDMDISWFCIQRLNFGWMVLKVKFHRTYVKICTQSQFEGAKYESDINILISYVYW